MKRTEKDYLFELNELKGKIENILGEESDTTERKKQNEKVILHLKPVEIEYLISALNDSMENYKDDFEMFEVLLDLKLKIRKEYEICTLLD